jgi:hypothetical protein
MLEPKLSIQMSEKLLINPVDPLGQNHSIAAWRSVASTHQFNHSHSHNCQWNGSMAWKNRGFGKAFILNGQSHEKVLVYYCNNSAEALSCKSCQTFNQMFVRILVKKYSNFILKFKYRLKNVKLFLYNRICFCSKLTVHSSEKSVWKESLKATV